MNNHKSLAALLAVLVALTPAIHPRSSAYKAHPQEAERANHLQKSTVNRMQDVLSKPYFSADLVLSNQARNIALATHKIGFIRATKDKVIVCRYDYLAGKIDLTKYEKGANGKDLRAVKTESYTHFVDDTLQCTRKTKDARKSTPTGEGIARIIRATTNPKHIKYTSFADLYEESIPTWVQADSATDVAQLLECLKEDLDDRLIAPEMLDDLAKPVVLFSLKQDLFLDSFDNSLWANLKSTFNVTTFLDKDLRKLTWEARNRIVESKKIAKDGGIDLNPSLIEGIFSDLEKDSGYFDTKLMIRQTFKGVWKRVTEWGIPALVTVGLAWSAVKIYRAINKSDRKDMIKKAQDNAIQINVNKAVAEGKSRSAILSDPQIWVRPAQ